MVNKRPMESNAQLACWGKIFWSGNFSWENVTRWDDFVFGAFFMGDFTRGDVRGCPDSGRNCPGACRYFLFFLQVAFDRSRRSICPNACFAKKCAFWESRRDNKQLHLRGFIRSPPKKTRIGISQPNRRSRNIAIYRSSTKMFASNYTDRFIGHYRTNAKLRQTGS